MNLVQAYLLVSGGFLGTLGISWLVESSLPSSWYSYSILPECVFLCTCLSFS